MEEVTRSLEADGGGSYPPIRTKALELVDDEGVVCLRLCAGQDGPELTIPADPTVCRGPVTASLRVLTGGSYGAIRPLDERVSDIEDLLALFGAAVEAWQGGTILPPVVPGWERRDMLADAEVAARGGGAL